MFARCRKRLGHVVLAFLALVWPLCGSSFGALEEEKPTDPAAAPRPRLSFVDGDVSFWRPGADDWSPARINTPLAPGDQLFTGTGANVEVQIGQQDYVRAGAETQLGIENQSRDALQLKVTGGHVALDLRSLAAGQTIEVDTPNATFTTQQPGYYRIDVSEESTIFITRRGGRATIAPQNGVETGIVSNDQVTVTGTAQPRIDRYSASNPDPWDQWNTDRTDALAAPVSQRYVSQGMYGLDSLDQNGTWRVVPSYGWVWSPSGVPAGWAPYSAGRWIWDPFYGWTWLDNAPWGWAPFHWGRWVFVGGAWGWAPGPAVAWPVWSPALVGFYGGVNFGIGFGFGAPIGWVSLGWGEPLVPWWGGVGFFGRPCWWGWGGPRVVNNVVINNTTIINANNIKFHRNRSVDGGLVTVRHSSFGNGPVQRAWLDKTEMNQLRPINGSPPARPNPHSFVTDVGTAQRPPQTLLDRPVVSSRPPAQSGTRGVAVASANPFTSRPPGAPASAGLGAAQQPGLPAAQPRGGVPLSRGGTPGQQPVQGLQSSPRSVPHGVTQHAVPSTASTQGTWTRQAPPPISGAGPRAAQPPAAPRAPQQTNTWPSTMLGGAPRPAPVPGYRPQGQQAPPPPRSSAPGGRVMQVPAPPASRGAGTPQWGTRPSAPSHVSPVPRVAPRTSAWAPSMGAPRVSAPRMTQTDFGRGGTFAPRGAVGGMHSAGIGAGHMGGGGRGR